MSRSKSPARQCFTLKTAASSHPEDKGMYVSSLVIIGAMSATVIGASLQRPFSVPLNLSHQDHEGPTRRLRLVAYGDLTTSIPGHPYILTVYDLVKNAVDKWKDKDCLGSRTVVKNHEVEKQITKVINGVEQKTTKKWVYSELSPFEYRTYRDLGEESSAIGAGLRNLGLNPGDHVGV